MLASPVTAGNKLLLLLLLTKSLTTAIFERLLKMAVGLKGITGSQGYTDVHVIVDSELFMLLGV